MFAKKHKETDFSGAARKANDFGGRKYGKVRLFATVGLCFLLFVLVITATMVLELRGVLSAQNIENAVSDIDTASLIDEFDIYNRIIDVLQDNVHRELDIHPASVARLLGSDPVREFVSENAAGYVDAFISGENHLINRQDIVRLIRSNTDLIYEETGYMLGEREYQGIEDFISSSDVLDDYSLSAVMPYAPINMGLLRQIFLPNTLIAAAGLILAVIAGIAVINMRHINKALAAACIFFLFTGITCLVIGLSLSGIVLALTGGIIGVTTMESLLSQTGNTAVLISLVLMAIGVVSLARVIHRENKRIRESTKR